MKAEITFSVLPDQTIIVRTGHGGAGSIATRRFTADEWAELTAELQREIASAKAVADERAAAAKAAIAAPADSEFETVTNADGFRFKRRKSALAFLDCELEQADTDAKAREPDPHGDVTDSVPAGAPVDPPAAPPAPAVVDPATISTPPPPPIEPPASRIPAEKSPAAAVVTSRVKVNAPARAVTKKKAR